MLIRPGGLDARTVAPHTPPRGDRLARSLGPGRPARRGAARVADERRLLLPLGAQRPLGHDLDAAPRVHLVPRGI